MAALLDKPNANVLPDVRSVEPITRLSNIRPYQYTFAIDIGETYEGSPSTLLQECSSITERNQPLTCGQLCEREGCEGETLLQCRLRKRNNFECCDTEIFNAGNARVLVDDVFSKHEVPESIMAGILGEAELRQEAAARTLDTTA